MCYIKLWFNCTMINCTTNLYVKVVKIKTGIRVNGKICEMDGKKNNNCDKRMYEM